ncbi:MAG: radical SAM protein, partial [Bryobacteraceae bacterium]|nr:radical SAM protein [Bryobacteraceae bacterium]
GKAVDMRSKDHSLILNREAVDAGRQTDLDEIGIAKNAREEKLRARAAKIQQEAEDAKMAQLYRQHVLKEQPGQGLVQLGGANGGILPAPPAAPQKSEETVMGD